MIRNDTATRRPLLTALALSATVVAQAHRLLVRAKARVGQIARPRPSRHELKQALWALAGCGAIIISMAGEDSSAG